MPSASLIADYILSLSNPDEGDIISNLKLQKLLYYVQGFHLAVYDAPIFDETIKRWEHGPVVLQVWQEYRDYGASALPVPEAVDFSQITREQKELINEVYETYGQFSAWKLRDMTHNEPPWKYTDENEEITHADLSRYFKTQLIN